MALVVVDTSVLIGFLDPDDQHHARAVAALTTHQRDRLVLPASVYAEVLVGPYRQGPEAVSLVRRVTTDLALTIEPLTAGIADRAARYRARHPGLGLPDALVLATGEALEADVVLTADRRWAKISSRVRLL